MVEAFAAGLLKKTCLHKLDTSEVEAHFGLEHKLKFLSVYRTPQSLFGVELFGDCSQKVAAEETQLVATKMFCPKHGGVCCAQECLGGRVMYRIDACTDAYGDQQFAALDQQWTVSVYKGVAALDDLLDALAIAVHQARPRTSAALNPAGPAPITTTSQARRVM
jgi:hypothetical protein